MKIEAVCCDCFSTQVIPCISCSTSERIRIL